MTNESLADEETPSKAKKSKKSIAPADEEDEEDGDSKGLTKAEAENDDVEWV